jgi:hypothetical protein
MKLVLPDGQVMIEGESREHIILQCLVYFECVDFKIDFENGTWKILNNGGEVVE